MGGSGLPITGIPATGSCSGFDVQNTYDNGYWRIDNDASTLTDGLYTITLNGETMDGITDICALTILKRSGSSPWAAPGTHLAPTGSTSYPILARSGMSGYSNFGFGGGPYNPLPVSLIHFNAALAPQRTVQLNWTTAIEVNNDHFVVERSKDGQHFEAIGTVKGQGNSTATTSYDLVDKNPYSGVNYYRLVQVDFDGRSSNSSMKVVSIAPEASHVYMYPNPVADFVMIGVDAELNPKPEHADIYDISGKVVLTVDLNQTNAKGDYKLDVSRLSGGVYTVRLSGNAQLQFEFVKF
jgi:hypothetical protein